MNEFDAIEREKIYGDGYQDGHRDGYDKGYNDAQRPQGHWKILENQGWFSDIYICLYCGNTLDMHGVNGGRGSANFCPNCGADMREDKE